jgi:hypothetical protein
MRQDVLPLSLGGGSGVALKSSNAGCGLGRRRFHLVCRAGSIERGISRLSPDNVITRPLGKGDVSLVPQQVLPGDRAALMISVIRASAGGRPA